MEPPGASQLPGKLATERVTYRPALDGVRAIAVLAVVAFHARSSRFPGGYIGVDIFFVLSGFLITSILLAEHRMHGRIALGRFFARRALRLLPALFVVCACVTVAFLLIPGITERSATLLGALTAITYTSSVVLAGDWSTLGWMIPTWSLSVEEYFYLLWPLVLIAATRRGTTTCRNVVLALTAAAIAYRILAATLFGWSLARVAYGADTRAEQLLIGCLLAVLLPGLRRSIPAALSLAAGLLLAGFMVLPAGFSGSLYYQHGGSTMVALLAALLIADIFTRPERLVVRALSVRPLVWVGQRSYGIYLWNLPIVAVIAATGLSDAVQLIVKLILSLIVPAISYRWVEVPFLRMKRS